jgi:hypothetical protein
VGALFRKLKCKVFVKFLQVQKIKTLIRGYKATILSRQTLTSSRRRNCYFFLLYKELDFEKNRKATGDSITLSVLVRNF